MPSPMAVHNLGSSDSVRDSNDSTTFHSSLSSSVGSGTAPAASYSVPLCTSNVASPPSSRIRFGPPPSGHLSSCTAHLQYPSRVSPFHAYTGTPLSAMAAAAWSCVEKMLQLHQRTCAPSAVSVSMSTAVWIVMCSEPVMRAPLSGCSSANSARNAMRPGISCSASSISLRPNAARDKSATLKSSVMCFLHEGACVVRSWAGTNWSAHDSPTAQHYRAPRLLGHCRLDVVEDGDGAGVDAFLCGELQTRHRPEEHEVEELCQRTVALGVHLLDAGHDLFGPLAHELEPAHHLRVLLVVAQQHEREHLPG